MEYNDLRSWLEMVDKMGELKIVEGAHWDKELGAISEMLAVRDENSPALLFDKIPGYPDGFTITIDYCFSYLFCTCKTTR